MHIRHRMLVVAVDKLYKQRVTDVHGWSSPLVTKPSDSGEPSWPVTVVTRRCSCGRTQQETVRGHEVADAFVVGSR